MEKNSIPSVNLADFLSSDINKKNNFVESIGKAFEEIGFVALDGHFLDSNFNKKLYKEIRSFLIYHRKLKINMKFLESLVKEVMCLLEKNQLKVVNMEI